MFIMEGVPSVFFCICSGAVFLLISFSPLFFTYSFGGSLLFVSVFTATACAFPRLMMVGLLYFDTDLFVIVVFFLPYHGYEGYGLNERWLVYSGFLYISLR